MSPLFSNFHSLPQIFSLGKLTHQSKDHFFSKETNKSGQRLLPLEGSYPKSKMNATQTNDGNRMISLLAKGSDPELQTNIRKVENRFRWSQWISAQSESKTIEVSELKPLWNYLLGETGFTDLLSFLDPEAKEFLQMVVEPKNKGLVLYVFWESQGTGAMGIQFHYDPEKEKPVLVHITTETYLESESFRKSLFGLVRDFPQIQSVQIVTWNEDSFNGDYR